MGNFEKRRSEYRESLNAYLYESRTTIVEYANHLGEEYIMSILEPENEEKLELAIQAFEMYRVINDKGYSNYLDIDTNLAYAAIKASIDGLKDRNQYAMLEEALTKIITDPKLSGRFEVETIQLMSSERSLDDLFEIFHTLISSNIASSLEKYERNLETLKEHVLKRIIISNPEYVIKTERMLSLHGMQAYIEYNQNKYNYIMNEYMPSDMILSHKGKTNK